ncbi:MAG: IscS subfamily cysteine desulfurase [Gammaproteobacteria bacterium]|nr:IscS subfamily cysteine desulfurase [Gammaproteobacteria bacterium]
MKKVIYLDYAATTPVDPVVAEKMAQCLTLDGAFGNPASRSHRYGWQAEELVDIARNQVADLLHADPREIIWTSGATEADNLAIKGAAYANLSGQQNQPSKGHIITSAIEHKAVLDTCAQMESEGFTVTYLSPDENGVISAEKVEQAIRPDTFLISIMHVNNEIGSINPIVEIGEVAHKHHILFHVDGAQSAGKLEIDMTKMPIDMMSFCAHKIYGPKGIGGLYVRKNQQPNILPLIHGGGHERGLRSGTLATHQIVGMGESFAISQKNREEESQRIRQLKNRLWQGIESCGGVSINGNMDNTVAGIMNICFDYVDSETLLMVLKDIAVSSGSACTSASVEPSYVLKALGLSDEKAHSSLRLSLGRFTTEADVDEAITIVRNGLEKLRALSPEWQAKHS